MGIAFAFPFPFRHAKVMLKEKGQEELMCSIYANGQENARGDIPA
jgi:hypothetical protein